MTSESILSDFMLGEDLTTDTFPGYWGFVEPKREDIGDPCYSFYRAKKRTFIVAYFKHNCRVCFENNIEHPNLERFVSKKTIVPSIEELWEIKMFLPEKVTDDTIIIRTLEDGVSVDDIANVSFSHREKVPFWPRIMIAGLARSKWD